MTVHAHNPAAASQITIRLLLFQEVIESHTDGIAIAAAAMGVAGAEKGQKR
jgi:hypothetical protein